MDEQINYPTKTYLEGIKRERESPTAMTSLSDKMKRKKKE